MLQQQQQQQPLAQSAGHPPLQPTPTEVITGPTGTSDNISSSTTFGERELQQILQEEICHQQLQQLYQQLACCHQWPLWLPPQQLLWQPPAVQQQQQQQLCSPPAWWAGASGILPAGTGPMQLLLPLDPLPQQQWHVGACATPGSRTPAAFAAPQLQQQQRRLWP
jgi:hypothetical protein